ncbi:hypothetical protein BSKO_00364 [Bryopsis sp. KO-2023]|nr:hypothetical protein BSKO_00364 [Bryopsis sp. KO-2023]
MDDRMEEDNTQRGVKRGRSAEYPRGTLKRIVVHNFMTYSYARLEAEPKLNVILGPNGTGKSSVVCALCLALAGSPQLLARQSHNRSFVRRGATEGYAEVTVSGGNGTDYTIRRCINSSDDSSVWSVNGSSATLEDVKKLKKEMNIQLDNLLQFMPQDRVVEFSNLSPISLLLETERAIGDADLYDKHKQLIELGNQSRMQHTTKNHVQTSLEKVKSELEDMEMDVARVRKRDELLQESENIKAKVMWVGIWDLKAKCDDTKSKLQMGLEQKKKCERELKHAATPGRAMKARLEALQKEITQSENNSFPLQGNLERYNEALNDFESDMATRQEKITSLNRESQKYHADIQRTKDRIAEYQSQLASHIEFPAESLRRMEQINPEIVDIRTKLRAEGKSLDERESRREHHSRHIKLRQDYIEKISRATAQRVMQLEKRRDKFVGLFNAYEWVRANKDKFKGEVYGPLIAEVSVKENYHAAVLEQMVAISTWSCFVVSNSEDMWLLRKQLPAMNIMRDVNVIVVPDANEPLKRNNTDMTIPEVGIHNTLDQVFDAPHMVKLALNLQHGVTEVYVGNQDTENNAQKVLYGYNQVKKLATPNSIYGVIVSRYGNNARTIQTSGLRGPSLLRSGGKNEEVAKIKEEIVGLQRDVVELDKEMQERRLHMESLHEENAKLAQELKDLKQNRDEITKNKAKLSKEISALNQSLICKERQPDPKDKKADLEKQKEDAKRDIVEKVKETMKLQRVIVEQHNVMGAKQYALKELELLVTLQTRRVQHFKVALDRVNMRVNQLRSFVAEDEKRFKTQEHIAQGTYPLDANLRKKFEEYPDGADDLEELSHQKECEAAGINCNNTQALQDYQKRKKEVEMLTKQMEKEQSMVDQIADRIAVIKSDWLPRLTATVEKVNKTFMRNFKLIGSVGEVELAGEEKHGDDYRSYALEIRVKFRNTESLKALDSSTQSGGERSVSTMLYLISLQSVTRTPFRVVDEINQGMDAVNERKIFDILVASAGNEGTPQCFLLTPKLLPDLNFNENVTVQAIFNGPEVPPSSEQEEGEDQILGQLLGSRLSLSNKRSTAARH